MPTKSVNVGTPTIWQPNKTDTGKRQNTAVCNTEPPRPELGGAVFFRGVSPLTEHCIDSFFFTPVSYRIQ